MQVIAKRRIGGAIVCLVFGVLSAVFGAVTLATGLGTMSDLAKKIVGALFVVSGGVLTIVMLARLLGRPVEILLCDEFMLAVNKKSKFTLSAKPAAADDKYLYFRKSDVDSVFYCKAQRFGKDKDYFKYLWLCVLLGFLGFFIVCLIILIDNRGQYYPDQNHLEIFGQADACSVQCAKARRGFTGCSKASSRIRSLCPYSGFRRTAKLKAAITPQTSKQRTER